MYGMPQVSCWPEKNSPQESLCISANLMPPHIANFFLQARRGRRQACRHDDDRVRWPQMLHSAQSYKPADHATCFSMIGIAKKLGGFLPGAYPQYMPPGSVLHICVSPSAFPHT